LSHPEEFAAAVKEQAEKCPEIVGESRLSFAKVLELRS